MRTPLRIRWFNPRDRMASRGVHRTPPPASRQAAGHEAERAPASNENGDRVTEERTTTRQGSVIAKGRRIGMRNTLLPGSAGCQRH
jgi:hypothetical protein